MTFSYTVHTTQRSERFQSNSAGFRHCSVDHRVVVLSCFGPEEEIKIFVNLTQTTASASSGVPASGVLPVSTLMVTW